MFERYQEKGEWVPRDELSTRTRIHLRVLEKDYGFQFDDRALKATFGRVPSYIIYGTGPNGEDVSFERRSTKHGGETSIWISGKKHRLGEFQFPILAGQKERELVGSVLDEDRLWQIEEEKDRVVREYGSKLQELAKARAQAVENELRDLDLESLSQDEKEKVGDFIKGLIEKDLPPTPKYPNIRGPRFGLTYEERKAIKEVVSEYKKEIGEYRT